MLAALALTLALRSQPGEPAPVRVPVRHALPAPTQPPDTCGLYPAGYSVNGVAATGEQCTQSYPQLPFGMKCYSGFGWFYCEFHP